MRGRRQRGGARFEARGHRVHGHTTNLWPAVPLHVELAARSPSRAPRHRPAGRAQLGAATSTATCLTENLGVVDLGDDVGGGKPEVTCERVALLCGGKWRRPGFQLAKVLAGLEVRHSKR